MPRIATPSRNMSSAGGSVCSAISPLAPRVQIPANVRPRWRTSASAHDWRQRATTMSWFNAAPTSADSALIATRSAIAVSARLRSVTSWTATSDAFRPRKLSRCVVISTSMIAPDRRRCRSSPTRTHGASPAAPAVMTGPGSSGSRMAVRRMSRNSRREYPYCRIAAEFTSRNSSVSTS